MRTEQITIGKGKILKANVNQSTNGTINYEKEEVHNKYPWCF